ncbi:hypothetical protein QW180_11215 [Vibrio sinaloensis]|nr:hypothetical protein [Vibrio sinaloensis]
MLTAGEQIWVRQVEQTTDGEETVTLWQLSQVPNANTAFTAMNPEKRRSTGISRWL